MSRKLLEEAAQRLDEKINSQNHVISFGKGHPLEQHGFFTVRKVGKKVIKHPSGEWETQRTYHVHDKDGNHIGTLSDVTTTEGHHVASGEIHGKPLPNFADSKDNGTGIAGSLQRHLEGKTKSGQKWTESLAKLINKKQP